MAELGYIDETKTPLGAKVEVDGTTSVVFTEATPAQATVKYDPTPVEPPTADELRAQAEALLKQADEEDSK